MNDGDFYAGSRKYNINSIKINIDGDWKKDMINYPNSRYYFKVDDIECLLKRSDDLRYYGSIILKPSDRDYYLKNFDLINMDLYRFLSANGYKKDCYPVLSTYINDLKLFVFGFMSDKQKYIYYSFDDAKKVLEGIARFFIFRSKYQIDYNNDIKRIEFNNMFYDKIQDST